MERGVELVDQTGGALHRISQQVVEIDGVVATIATSAGLQAASLAQVNGAVGEIDQVTQQNASMVEETTAALRTLSEETDQLSELIRKFKTRQPATEARSRTPRAAFGQSQREVRPSIPCDVAGPSVADSDAGRICAKAVPLAAAITAPAAAEAASRRR